MAYLRCPFEEIGCGEAFRGSTESASQGASKAQKKLYAFELRRSSRSNKTNSSHIEKNEFRSNTSEQQLKVKVTAWVFNIGAIQMQLAPIEKNRKNLVPPKSSGGRS
jgi:hypothetical protein